MKTIDRSWCELVERAVKSLIFFPSLNPRSTSMHAELSFRARVGGVRDS